MLRVRSLALILPLALLAGCLGEEAPTAPILDADAPALARGAAGRDQAGRPPRFVQRAPASPRFDRETITIAAVAGSTSEATLRFVDGTPFARFSLGPDALVGATIDGVPVARGDTVRITLRRRHPVRYIVDMQPSGLQFNPDSPASVTFFYHHARIDSGSRLEAWKQHNEGEPWHRAGASDDRRGRRLKAEVEDFTIYALVAP